MIYLLILLNVNRFTSKIGILLAGIVIYFYLLYYSTFKYYWHDESFILLYLSGYSEQELVANLYDNQPKIKSELHKFQGVNHQRGLDDTVKLVANYSPQNPPLYFILLWLWSKVFGNSELVLRSFSIVLWLAFLPCFYWLSLTLFQQKLAALIATLLGAISPRFIHYSVAVQEYGLYALLIVLSSLLFLQAFNNTSSKYQVKWLSYTLALIAGLYTHIFFILIAFTHLLYFGINRKFTNSKNRQYYLISLIFTLLIYCPWIMMIFLKQATIYGWAKSSWSLKQLFPRWLSTLSSIFLDGQFSTVVSQTLNYLMLLVFITSVIIIIKNLSIKQSTFIILLIFTPFVSLQIWDMILGFRYASVGRFYLGTLLGIILSIAYLIYQGLIDNNKLVKKLTYIGLSILLFLGLFSNFLTLEEPNKYQGYGSIVINSSAIINQGINSLVLGETWYDLLPLSYKLNSNVQYLFINSSFDFQQLKTLDNYSDIYVINLSKSFKQQLNRSRFTIKPTTNPSLFKLEINTFSVR